MDKFQNVEEYNNLVNGVRKEFKPTLTNCYLYPEEVERYISQGRLYYEKYVGELLIYSDEMTHYRIYYYWNQNYPFLVYKKDKVCAVANIYRGAEKSEKLLKAEEALLGAGFNQGDRMRHIEADWEVFQKQLRKFLPPAEKLFLEAGLKVMKPTKEMCPKIREFQKHMETIPFYEMQYITDSEMCESGKVICIVNQEGEVCAVDSWGNQGWKGILEEYRKSCGISLIQCKLLAEHLQERKIKKLTGMISETNVQSIRFHFALGYHWVDRYTDFWLLES